MSTIDHYQNLRSLVASSVMDNLHEIEENIKGLFEDIATYFFFNGEKEAFYKMNRMEVKLDLSIKQPVAFDLNEEGWLIASCQPVLLSVLSLKEIRLLFLMDRETCSPYSLNTRINQKIPSSHKQEDYLNLKLRVDSLFAIIQAVYQCFRKEANPLHLDYSSFSEKQGDFFDQASYFFDQASYFCNDETESSESIPKEKGSLSLADCFSPVDLEEASKEAIYQFASYRQENSSPSSYGRGTNPWDEICKITRPKQIIPKWIKILTRFSSGRTREVRKTKTRLNRLQPQRFDLSGEIKERRPEVVCAIDTSGSRYADRIKKALGQVLALKVKFNYSITLIECDAKIQKITEIKKKSDIPDEYHGRGGTSYLPVIDYINSHPRYRNALLIYFTDGYGDGEIPKPKVRQTVWVLIGGDYLSLKNPYGDVVLIDGEKTIKRSR